MTKSSEDYRGRLAPWCGGPGAGSLARRTMRIIAQAVIATAIAGLLVACAGTARFETPAPFDDIELRQRARTVDKHGFRVLATIPSRAETQAIFGVDLWEKNIQPVWLEIENRTDRLVRFLPTGLDPEYFSPREVSFGFYKGYSKEARRQLDGHIEALNFEDPIEPHSTVSGFVYTNREDALQVVNVDLIAKKWSKGLTLFVPVPGQGASEKQLEQLRARLASTDLVRVEDAERLRELLEALPCCSTDAEGAQGEPLNLVAIGEADFIGAGFSRRGFRYSIASPRYAFGRQQDLVARKQAQWVSAQPHVMRLWLTDILYRGKTVWIGQIASSLGGRFASDTEQQRALIDPNVDEARLDLIQDMLYSQSLAKLGLVNGVGRVMTSKPRMLPNGGHYHTDGLRAVFVFEERTIGLSDIQSFEWERLIDHHRKQIDTTSTP